VAAFCRSREVHKSQFYYWKRRLNEAATPPFIEVHVPKARAEAFPAQQREQRLKCGSGMSKVPWLRQALTQVTCAL